MPDKIKKKGGGYDGLVAGLGLNIDREVIEKAENLKFIASAAAGLDQMTEYNNFSLV